MRIIGILLCAKIVLLTSVFIAVIVVFLCAFFNFGGLPQRARAARMHNCRSLILDVAKILLIFYFMLIIYMSNFSLH
ncbi:Protein kish [Caenorhabditis elegans]|uniref:Protein kish n=1 Tax=Caenorhabditis elegans TaxID=6239 RepID=Q9XVG5_CAEEL|nr:Protein kish [Caenorhabditis elegans]CAB03468.2 Protein kish [Caenorhabditis elegans]|eukprot:NP_493182.2 Uncharacterized protein CELE_W02D9.8 [Caenorhabditis elegans]